MRKNPRAQLERARTLIEQHSNTPSVGVALSWLDLKKALDIEAMRYRMGGNAQIASEYSDLARQAARAARRNLPNTRTMPRKADPLGIVQRLTGVATNGAQ